MNGLELVSAFKTGLDAFKVLKEIVSHWPNEKDRKEAEEILKRAEKDFEIAQAQAAKAFGYEICVRHWPPGVRVEIGEGRAKCKDCGFEDYTVGGAEAAAAKSASELKSMDVQILRYFLKISGQKATAEQVAASLKANVVEVEFCLGRLEENDYLRFLLLMNTPMTYELAQKGREYLVENNLLE